MTVLDPAYGVALPVSSSFVETGMVLKMNDQKHEAWKSFQSFVKRVNSGRFGCAGVVVVTEQNEMLLWLVFKSGWIEKEIYDKVAEISEEKDK